MAFSTLQEMNIIASGLDLDPKDITIIQTIEHGKPYGLSGWNYFILSKQFVRNVNVQRVTEAEQSEWFLVIENIGVQHLPHAEKQLTFCRCSLT